jgi:hypothetical protein
MIKNSKHFPQQICGNADRSHNAVAEQISSASSGYSKRRAGLNALNFPMAHCHWYPFWISLQKLPLPSAHFLKTRR